MRLSLRLAAALFVSLTPQSGLPADQKNARLEKVRSEIHSLKNNLAQDLERLDLAQKQTIKLQREIVHAYNKQTQLEREIQRKSRGVQELRSSKETILKQLEQIRSGFATNSTARYALTLQPKLKFLLNQNHSYKVSRNLLYYDYILHAYDRDAQKIQSRFRILESTEKSIQLETNSIKILRKETVQHLDLLRTVKSEHSELIGNIEMRMDERDRRLSLLQEDEAHLLKLISALEQNEDPRSFIRPFVELKGKLAWPATGVIVKAPGLALRQGGALWSGVLIKTNRTSNVKTVADGRVVFADWFRNLGRLIIVDHAAGYMSLYSNFSKLLVQPGAEVARGDVIARIGKGDGELAQDLYFELRSGGEPLDPRDWCTER